IIIMEYRNQVLIALYIMTLLTGLPANLLALYTFGTKVRTKPAPVDILLLNLTISDLIFLCFLPFKIIEAFNNMVWTIPYFLCPLSGFIYYSTIYISILFLTAVSVERYLGVAFPIKYKINRKPSYAVVTSVIFWVLAASHCSIVYIVQYQLPWNNTQNNSHCYDNFNPEQLKILLPVRLELFVVLFCVPFLITLFSYINFVRIILCLPNIRRKRKQRAISLALSTLIIFIVCFSPYNISHVVGFVQGTSPKWRVDALVLSTINASLDPVIFYFSSSAVQKNCKHFLKRVLTKIRDLIPCKSLCP
uniref:G-protein coupled receptors family 1 profile domain-containing protein n=1 Tax=Latimeria chalumnae TaxID=7897 RepID=H2ZSH4_LATCH